MHSLPGNRGFAREGKKVDQLGPTRRLACSRQLTLTGESVDGTGFTGIRAPAEGHFCPLIRRTLVQYRRALEENSTIEIGCQINALLYKYLMLK